MDCVNTLTPPITPAAARTVFATARRDRWWVSPILILVSGAAAIVYFAWAAFEGAHFSWGPYVSPLYAAPFLPSWWKISPAFLLLWIPVGFRATCYYARKMYYRAAFWDPANCAVHEPYRKRYRGETAFPFVLNNFHRFFLILALGLVLLHWGEWIAALRHEGSWYLGVGTFIILLDTVALTVYVVSCHSLRHLVGGGRRCLSCGCCGRVRRTAWQRVSFLNAFHGVWFWISLYSIIIADFYIRLLAGGVVRLDPHFVF